MGKIAFLPHDSLVQKLDPALTDRITAAQQSLFSHEFRGAKDVVERVVDDLKLAITPETPTKLSAEEFADQSFAILTAFYLELLSGNRIPIQGARLQAEGLAARTHLLRAFKNPDHAIEFVRNRGSTIAATFPRKAQDIEVGKNKGDVLDPFILAAAQHLLHEGNFESAIGSTVAHKALMMIEGLLGHLNEDVIGMMRGNVRIPEPRGADQESFDPILNPFPGADILQPPLKSGDRISLHQVKTKTGSAKGGDGRRLGEQLRFLASYYNADIYYHALIGNTLSGHRSKTGVERAAPSVVVMVGETSFRTLTRSRMGPQLLLRLYQEAFCAIALTTPYSIRNIAESIASFFTAESEKHGKDFLETVLLRTVGGNENDQDSRLFNKRRKRTQG